MGKRFILSESEKSEIRRLYHLSEQEMMGAKMQPEKQPQEGKKLFCNAENTKSIHNLTGSEDFEDYIEGIKMRKGGVRGLVDMLEVLKTMRLFPQITDGGVDLASKIHGTLQEFKPYNYFEEQSEQCNRAMDKIIELYKENEHGEELVKDIEKVYALSYLDPRAKEFLKHGLTIVKGGE
jgi:hypothetical protein